MIALTVVADTSQSATLEGSISIHVYNNTRGKQRSEPFVEVSFSGWWPVKAPDIRFIMNAHGLPWKVPADR